jgi:hypothetical protein
MTSGGQTLRPEERLDRMKKLKLSLEEIEKQLQYVQIPHEALEDFKTAVDQNQMTVWGILSPPDTDLLKLMAHFRIKHTIEMCNRIMVDVASGLVLEPNQVQKFRATLEDTLSQLRKAY